MPIYSHSRISAFEQCPLKFKYAYLDGVKLRRKTIEAFMGSRFHEVMEHLYGRLSFERPELGKLTALFNEKWDREFSDKVEVIRKDRDPEDYRKIGLKALEDYFHRHEPFEEGHVLGIEKNIITNLGGSDKHRVRCIIDRLMKRDDGVYEIHDYKTSSSLPTQADVDGDRQLALYEIAVREAWPEVRDVELVWHYVAFDEELRSKRSPDALEDLAAETAALIDRIEETREFSPKESTLCEWCDFLTICPLFAHRFKTSGFGSVDYEGDDGQTLVNRYASLDAQKRELKVRIREIESEQEKIKTTAVEVAGREGVKRLFGDDHVLNVRDDLKVAYPKKGEIARTEFEATMKRLGIWEEITDVSWSSLKSLAERSGWSEAARIPVELGDFISVEQVKQVKIARRKDRKGDDNS